MPGNEDSPRKKNIREEMRSHLANRDLFEQAKSYAYDYMDEIFDRSVFPTEEAIDALRVFDEPLPEESCEPAEILHLLHDYGSPATVAHTGGRYFGFVNGGAVPTALAARWLSDVWDQNFALYVISPIQAVDLTLARGFFSPGTTLSVGRDLKNMIC